jgi:hypothetical protein
MKHRLVGIHRVQTRLETWLPGLEFFRTAGL